MLQLFKTNVDKIEEIPNFQRDCWINIFAPSIDEIDKICTELKLPPYVFQDLMDTDERSRIETNEDFMMIILRIPIENSSDSQTPYVTLPLGLILTDRYVLTICSKQSSILTDFIENKIRGFSTHSKNKFILQIFFNTALTYLKYLKEINKMSNVIEKELQKSMENKELVKLLNLEKSLVFFTTSIKSNEIMMERVQKNRTFRVNTEEDSMLEDALVSLALRNEKLMERLQKNQVFIINSEEENLLEDVIIENRQAIEMANIYTDILNGLMDAFASIISNNLNLVMKFLASTTLLVMIPSLFISLFSMNLKIPLQDHPYAFLLITVMATALVVIALVYLKVKKLF